MERSPTMHHAHPKRPRPKQIKRKNAVQGQRTLHPLNPIGNNILLVLTSPYLPPTANTRHRTPLGNSTAGIFIIQERILQIHHPLLVIQRSVHPPWNSTAPPPPFNCLPDEGFPLFNEP